MNDASETPSRSFVLVFIVFLMNAFLVITALSAAMALADDLVIKSAMGSQYFSTRSQVELLDIVLLLIAVVALILVPHLPKIVLLPPVLVAVWQLLGAPGVTWSLLDHASLARLDAMLLAATVLAFVVNRMTTGKLFMSARNLPFHDGLGVRTVIAMPIALIAIIVIGVGAVLSAIPAYIEQQSRGYLHFASQGLEVRDATLVKGDHVVHLIGMVHIGDPKFYQDLYRSIPADALVLAEGVTDRQGKMQSKPTYDNAARGLGLESQGEFQQLLQGSNMIEPLPVPPQPGVAAPAQPPANPAAPHVLFADIDVSDLSPSTLKFLEAVGTVFQAPGLQAAIQRYVSISRQFKEDEVKGVMDEILTRRNDHVIAAFDKYEPQYKVIYMPWGALHMPGIEDKLLARGYRVQSSRMLLLANYDTIMSALSRTMEAQPEKASPPAPPPAPVQAEPMPAQ